MISKVTLFSEQEIFLPLMIKIKVIPVCFKNHDLKFTQVDFTGVDLEQYYILELSRKTLERNNILYQNRMSMYIALM